MHPKTVFPSLRPLRLWQVRHDAKSSGTQALAPRKDLQVLRVCRRRYEGPRSPPLEWDRHMSRPLQCRKLGVSVASTLLSPRTRRPDCGPNVATNAQEALWRENDFAPGRRRERRLETPTANTRKPEGLGESAKPGL